MPTAIKLSNSYGFPNPRVLESMVQALKPDPADFYLMSKEAPIKPHPTETIEWWEELPIVGRTAAYTLDTDPKVRKKRGGNHHLERTSYWKDTAILDESDFLRVGDMMRFDSLAGRQLITNHIVEGDTLLNARIESLIADAMVLGKVTINENNIKREIDYGYVDGYNKVTAGVSWDDPQANIVGNLQSWIRKFRGFVKRGVRIVMNGVTAEAMMENQKVLNLFRQSDMAKELGRDNFPAVVMKLVGSSLVTSVMIYDEGYLDDSGVFQPFIPDGKVLILGTPPNGESIGNFITTPNLTNGMNGNPKPGKILGVIDKTDDPERPRYKTVHGIYGIPIIRYVKCVISATVLF